MSFYEITYIFKVVVEADHLDVAIEIGQKNVHNIHKHLHMTDDVLAISSEYEKVREIIEKEMFIK